MRFYKEMRPPTALPGTDAGFDPFSARTDLERSRRNVARGFPDARFVVLYRNPYETIPSLPSSCRSANAGRFGRAHCRVDAGDDVDLSYETLLYPREVLQKASRDPARPSITGA